MIKVLVTGAGGGVGQGIIKALKMIDDIDIYIVTADMSPLATGLYAGEKAYIVPACSAPEYLDELYRIFEKEKVDYYFPGTDLELYFCSQNKKDIELKSGVRVVVSNSQAVTIADDKYKTYEFLKQKGFYYPLTWKKEEIDFLVLCYPIILKPAIGCRSIGVHVVSNEETLKQLLQSEENTIVQQLVGSDDSEYTCTIVGYEGKYSDVVVLKRVLRAGDTYRAEPIKSEIIEKYVLDVARALEIEGSCNFQLRTDSQGIPKIFEINCRFSGTTPFCAQLGMNPVEFYLKNSLKREYKSNINYSSIVLRHWSEVLVEKENVTQLEQDKQVVPSYNKKVDLF